VPASATSFSHDQDPLPTLASDRLSEDDRGLPPASYRSYAAYKNVAGIVAGPSQSREGLGDRHSVRSRTARSRGYGSPCLRCRLSPFSVRRLQQPQDLFEADIRLREWAPNDVGMQRMARAPAAGRGRRAGADPVGQGRDVERDRLEAAIARVRPLASLASRPLLESSGSRCRSRFRRAHGSRFDTDAKLHRDTLAHCSASITRWAIILERAGQRTSCSSVACFRRVSNLRGRLRGVVRAFL
jgi:hypothetical protein